MAIQSVTAESIAGLVAARNAAEVKEPPKEEPKTEAKEPEGDKPKNGVQERISELTRKNKETEEAWKEDWNKLRQAQARIDELEKLTSPPAPVETEPDPAKYESTAEGQAKFRKDFAEYVEKRTVDRVRREDAERRSRESMAAKVEKAK